MTRNILFCEPVALYRVQKLSHSLLTQDGGAQGSGSVKGSGEEVTCLCCVFMVSTVTEKDGREHEHLNCPETKPNGDLGKGGIVFWEKRSI